MSARFLDLFRRAPGTSPAASVAADGKKRAGKKAKQKCQKQVGQCQPLLPLSCEGDAECIAKSEFCCTLLGTCDVAGFLACTIEREI